MLSGREGADRFPQAEEPSLPEAVLRSLRSLDSSIQLSFVEDVIALYEEHEVLRARDATVKTKPQDVKAYFKAQFRRIVKGEQAPALRVSLRATPTDDPYG
jgi:hypothetical protein